MTLRELRLWHWRKVISSRANANKHREAIRYGEQYPPSYHQHRVNSSTSIADFHAEAVRALDPYVTGAAELDMIEADNRKKSK